MEIVLHLTALNYIYVHVYIWLCITKYMIMYCVHEYVIPCMNNLYGDVLPFILMIIWLHVNQQVSIFTS